MLAELRDDYADYLQRVDELADGPSRRLVEAAFRDKERQIEALSSLELSADDPARDPAYFASPIYWPDVLDRLPVRRGRCAQVRSAVQPPGQVWAVGGRADLDELSPSSAGVHTRPPAGSTTRRGVGGEAAARWAPSSPPTARRLHLRGLAGRGSPTGSGCQGTSAKNIGASATCSAFPEMGDARRVDMEFDWADDLCTPSTRRCGGRCSSAWGGLESWRPPAEALRAASAATHRPGARGSRSDRPAPTPGRDARRG